VRDYVTEYFDRHAQRWVEAAYVGGVRFPVGPERVRLALEGTAPALHDGSRLVDLGCGGGQLCVQAAQLGWNAVGVDVAEGMIEEARAYAGAVDVEWIVGSYDESGVADGEAAAVTALGLIEYLDDDAGLFAEAARLLGHGGRFAVSCRNRLYNLLSANDYTRSELLESGDGLLDGSGSDAPRLLDELRDALGAASDDALHALALSVAERADELRAAVEADRAEPPPELHDHVRAFQRGRRQHTPAELDAVAGEHGLRHAETLALHPHPLPPALEPLAPRTYNALALAWQRPLERSPVGLAFSTAFVAVFERA
jgi:SAM-dependent methyltransferase